MSRVSWDGEERRLHERHSIVFPVEVQVANPGRPLERLAGVSVKIGRGGALLRLDKDARPGARCLVSFRQSAGRVEPATASGMIRRSAAGKPGSHMVAVQFDHLLEKVKAPGEL